jgi:hypothetical protein
MEVEPPQAAAAAVAAALQKCRADGGEARLEACGKAAARSPSREAQETDGTPRTGRRRGEEEVVVEAEEEPLRRGLAAAQARARARRKAGHATPSPSWKLEPSPPRLQESASAAPAEADAGAGRRGAPVASARQLGATLWEIQDVIRVAGAGRRIRRRGRRVPAVDEASADADRVRTSPSASFSPSQLDDVCGQLDVCMCASCPAFPSIFSFVGSRITSIDLATNYSENAAFLVA